MSSGHHHDEHHSLEQKPVSFTVPFYLAVAFLIIMLMFLSLCDPKPHHAASHDSHEGPAATEHPAAGSEEHH
jgi:hypothetical protein